MSKRENGALRPYEEIDTELAARARLGFYMAVVAESMPRRLGKDATREELARDKKIARRVSNLYRSQMKLVKDVQSSDVVLPEYADHGERIALARDATPTERSAGATVIWDDWLRAAELRAEQLAVEILTLVAEKGMPLWGGRRTNILDIEQKQLNRIMTLHK